MIGPRASAIGYHRVNAVRQMGEVTSDSLRHCASLCYAVGNELLFGTSDEITDQETVAN